MTADHRRAAVFDLDGTLVNTEPGNRARWARLFDTYGAPYDDALIASFAGRRGREVLAELAHLFPGRTVEELFREVVSYELGPEVLDAVPVPGAVALVRSVSAVRVPIGVVTSGGRRYAEGQLTRLGIRGLVDVLVTAEDVAEGKPAPEGFLTACARLGVAPGEAVAFEDAPAGVAAAKAAGMPTVGVATTQTRAALAAADLVVSDLTEVSWPPDFGG
ncbi:MAG TPA: HAD family phosphatase [Streptosporangiaceae bacterium]|nr:HAD family phosphatase [Streptosporangiaceae bacterium]